MNIRFDVMLRERYVCTLTMPVTLDLIDGYEGDEPLIELTALDKKIREYVIKKRPSLRNEKFKCHIC